jgi:methylated-DNA-[protein]-cysteine S-methyltransferase
MAVRSGSCKFGWWYVHVHWTGDTVQNVRFSNPPLEGDVPAPLKRYLAGTGSDLTSLCSVATEGDSLSARIYRTVQVIPYGKTATYGGIAAIVGTGPRVVGNAMARNPTPLIVPCHRVVGVRGLGGFSPSIEIKEALLRMERKGARKDKAGQGKRV